MSNAQIYQIGMSIQTKKKPDRRNQAFVFKTLGVMNEIKFSTTIKQ